MGNPITCCFPALTEDKIDRLRGVEIRLGIAIILVTQPDAGFRLLDADIGQIEFFTAEIFCSVCILDIGISCYNKRAKFLENLS